MTCRVLVFAPDGPSVEARDNGSTSPFVSERLAQSLRLPRSKHKVCVSGIAGSLSTSRLQSVASFQISSTYTGGKKIDLTAIVLPKVTCDLPVSPVPFDLSWTHIPDLPLADPAFEEPQRIDVLFLPMSSCKAGGLDLLDHLLPWRQFGWVLCGGNTDNGSSSDVNLRVTSLHASAICSDDVLRKFWEIEESPVNYPALSLEERSVVQHFEANHSRTKGGRFVVPLPRKPDSKPIGESRSQAVRRFLSLERSLHHKGRLPEVQDVMQEYLTLGHAEAVPTEDMDKPPESVFYLPMHVVYKDASTTTKVRAVFDASAKSTSGSVTE